MKKFIVLAGASWSGKDTVKKKIEDNFEYYNLISTTTRLSRKWEVDWVNYNFITHSEFDKKINNNEILEYAEFNNNYYWKQVKDLNKLIKENKNIITIFETEWVKNILTYKSYLKVQWYELIIIFLDISKDEIEKRMLNRWDDKESITQRLNNGDYEYFQEIKEIADIIINADNTEKKIYNEIISYL